MAQDEGKVKVDIEVVGVDKFHAAIREIEATAMGLGMFLTADEVKEGLRAMLSMRTYDIEVDDGDLRNFYYGVIDHKVENRKKGDN